MRHIQKAREAVCSYWKHVWPDIRNILWINIIVFILYMIFWRQEPFFSVYYDAGDKLRAAGFYGWGFIGILLVLVGQKKYGYVATIANFIALFFDNFVMEWIFQYKTAGWSLEQLQNHTIRPADGHGWTWMFGFLFLFLGYVVVDFIVSLRNTNR